MKCPIDGSTLSITMRDDVEIDYCPECRGVWLDRGELDKIIDRAASSPTAAPGPSSLSRDHRDDRRGYDNSRYDERPRFDDRRHDPRATRQEPSKKRKRKSFLEDLFEFD